MSICSGDGLFCRVLADKESMIVGPRSVVVDPLDGYVHVVLEIILIF